VIPQDYSEWRCCIEVECGLALTAEFIAQRITELGNLAHERTQQFVRLYGAAHHAQVLRWFLRSRKELEHT